MREGGKGRDLAMFQIKNFNGPYNPTHPANIEIRLEFDNKEVFVWSQCLIILLFSTSPSFKNESSVGVGGGEAIYTI